MVKNRNTLSFKLFFMLITLGLVLSVPATDALAADYPSKTIEMVVWASPGGGSDRMCRTFIKATEGIFSQSLYAVNKGGGGGAVGMSYVQGKPADGYTLLGVTNNLVFTPLTKPELKYSAKDFTPIIMWGFDAKAIAVKANGPYKTIEDFVNAAKKAPGKIKIGTFGLGTDDHIVGILLGKAAGATFGYVPFDSDGEQLAALLGGHIDATVTEVNQVAGQVSAGEVSVIAIAAGQRLADLADVPTLLDKGWDVVVPKFRGLVVKKGTPDAVVDYLISASLTSIQTPVFKDYLTKSMIEPYFLVGQSFNELIMKQEKEFGAILKEIGF
ncbi:MAG: tripartite tricarboxylate transporter substrate binding protein [Desulfobacterales bacterium]